MHRKKLISGLLRIGVAFSFLYPAIDSFFHPDIWIGFLPSFVLSISPVDATILLIIFSVVEIIIALSILFMKRPVTPAIFAVIVLGAIIVFDWSAIDIVFRDISILLMAMALVALHKKYRY